MNTPLRRLPAVCLAPVLLGSAFLLSLSGCASEPGYASGPRHVEVVASDDYVYYPGYEVYYSNTRRQYVYRDGSRWVTRPQPPRGWNQQAASVHIDFHDAPERHHAEVVRNYPKTWKPQAQPRPNPPQQNNDHRGDNDHKGDNDHRDHDDRKN